METPLTDESEARRQRLAAIRAAGINPYPARTERTHTIAQTVAEQDIFEKNKTMLFLVGRIRSIRAHGGSAFMHLEDGSGRFQLFFKRDELGEKSYAQLKDFLDIGDFLQVKGTVFVTKRGEYTLSVSAWTLLCKSLQPLPEKWHGLQDMEIRFRKRYLDLIANEASRVVLKKRAGIIQSIRATMAKHDFLEIETPTLQPIYGGGFARPFKTHHNTLDADFYLRISDEMYLKRALVGGMERVYEITKVFRNEGMDKDHNPEFTMFEAQAAYEDYHWGMDMFEEIFESAARTVNDSANILHGETDIELKRPWKRMSVVESIKEIANIDVLEWNNTQEAVGELENVIKDKTKRSDMKKRGTVGELIGFAFEELVEEKLIQPTIIYDYPVEISPLAKRARDPLFTERFEAFALGSEIGNNYTELNDPIDLRERFAEERRKKDSGFEEAHQTDDDYLEAIEHGMPPACGLGIGVDRMVMLLTGAQNIREVILFPTLRPKEKE